ncbi:MAG: ribbon-helix-helix domain-containing protein [Halobacteria archaeon]
MSGASSRVGDEPEMTQVTLKLTKEFLDDLDATWKNENFTSRSEFMRWVLRDAVEHPRLSRSSWKDIATAEHRMRKGEAEIFTEEEVKKDND